MKLTNESMLMLCWLLITFSVVPGCQSTGNVPEMKITKTSVEQPFKFPNDWAGSWKGNLDASYPGGRMMTYAMELQIAQTDDPNAWTWQLIYGEGDKRQVRDYELQIVKAEFGEYLIDEKNSIIIPSSLAGNQLVCLYSVEDAIMTVRYERCSNGIIFTLESYQFGNPVISGGDGEVPQVSSYPLTVVQHALLQKNDNP